MLYNVEWLIKEPDIPSSEISSSMELATVPEAASNVAVRFLGMLQNICSGGPVVGVQLNTTGVANVRNSGPVAPSSGLSGQDLLCSMIKSASQEIPQVSFSFHGTDPLASCRPTPPSCVRLSQSMGNTGEDVHGSTVRARALMSPVLTRTPILMALHAARLIPKPRGALQNLVPEPIALAPPVQGQILVAVKGVGVNFRDVLNVLGMYPGDPGSPGGDCSGIVVDSGIRSGHVPGSYVFGQASGSLGSHVYAPAERLVPMPKNLDFEEAATTPTVFITGDMALNSSAQVVPGDRVLVHAAAGGVGLAVIQLLGILGVEAFTTAGSPMKRRLLRSLGVGRVSSSRDIKFTEEFSAFGGVDVVINSLTSPGMLAASLALLRKGGRLVEISKRDIWSQGRVTLERPDAILNTLAVDFLPGNIVNCSLTKLALGLAAGRLTPLPSLIYKISSVATALRRMSQALHVGKVVVNKTPAPIFGITGRITVIGGLGSLGRLIGTWLATNGARRLNLLGRNGHFSGSEYLVFLSSAAQITFSKCDASRRADLPVAFGDIEHPTEAMFHASGVLHDNTMLNQTCLGTRRVFAPKTACLLWCLQHHAMFQPLMSQIVFSSISALLGSPGQVNYSAANGVLDEYASTVETQGLLCTSVQWGAWAGAGMSTKRIKFTNTIMLIHKSE